MIIVTGAAGFIGSALIWALNRRGENNILAVDAADHEEKRHNLAPLKFRKLESKEGFRMRLAKGEFDNSGVRAIVHLGAISSTTEQDWNLLEEVNVNFSKEIIGWCIARNVRCVYASSAATYGRGELGYSDEHALFDKLSPLNLYGKSKLLVDIWARNQGFLDQAVGLRYFNVFGPNEYHKADMQSVVAKKFPKARKEGVIELFKSYNPVYADGGQKRDFLYIKDAVKATLFFLDRPEIGGVFNVGTGVARSWNDVAHAMYSALGKQPHITYVDMPKQLQGQYQNFTEADISKLRRAGFGEKFNTLETGIQDYIQHYLLPHRHLSL